MILRPRFLLAAVCYLMCCGLSARAQTARGLVVDAAGAAARGVVVQLLDSTQHVVARQLTGARGAFLLAAPAPGNFRLRVLRIGFQPTLSDPVLLAPGSEVTQVIALSGARVVLDTMRVATRATCSAAGDTVGSALPLWEQVRTALTATQLSLADSSRIATIIAYERRSDPGAMRLVADSARTVMGLATQPWLSASVDELHGGGYVRNDPSGTTYIAPGLEVLLADAFVEDHCLRLLTTPRLGIAFEPTRDRESLPEISGTLWLDSASLELRSLDFNYVHLSVEQRIAHGHMAFVRLATGAWVISDWSITMPRLEQRTVSNGIGRYHHMETQVVIGGVVEQGGVLAMLRAGDDTLWVHAPVSFVATPPGPQLHTRFLGVARLDSTHAPVAGVEIAIPDASLATTTNEKGQFELRGVPPGVHKISARKLGYGKLDTTLTFRVGASLERDIVLTRVATLDSVKVTARAVLPSFEEHRAAGFGHFFTREDLAKVEGIPLADVLASNPGISVAYGIANHAWATASRGPKSLMGNGSAGGTEYEGRVLHAPSACYMHVYLDNLLVFSGREREPLFDLSTLSPDRIEAIEIYSGAAQIPMMYQGLNTNCGVLVIWTRRTFDSTATPAADSGRTAKPPTRAP